MGTRGSRSSYQRTGTQSWRASFTVSREHSVRKGSKTSVRQYDDSLLSETSGRYKIPSNVVNSISHPFMVRQSQCDSSDSTYPRPTQLSVRPTQSEGHAPSRGVVLKSRDCPEVIQSLGPSRAGSVCHLSLAFSSAIFLNFRWMSL